VVDLADDPSAVLLAPAASVAADAVSAVVGFALAAGVRECLQELGAELVDLEPGMTIHGHDIGRWLNGNARRWSGTDSRTGSASA
jgi:hypothetical protein